MKRNKLFTFLWSLIPGAGHMYYGFYRQGIQLMCMFLAVFAISEFLNLDILLFLLPVIWFFSFFHINNLSKLPLEELSMKTDHWFFLETVGIDTKPFYLEFSRYTPSGAAILICLGALLLGQNIINMIGWILPSPFSHIMNAITWRFPQIFVSIIIIYIGVRMIQRKKKELEQDDEEC